MRINLKKLFIGLVTFFCISHVYANEELISVFPLDNYDQKISTWIKPDDKDYDHPLLSEEMQRKRFDIFYDHYFGAASPWNSDYVNLLFRQAAPNDIKTVEEGLITQFSNQNKSEKEIGYGENFRPYAQNWIEGLSNNINSAQFNNLTYQANNRAITITNLHARVLPTEDVHFYSHKLPGEGYPFDNLQMSALWAGTPVYIVGETRDRAWSLVITPDYIAWVQTSGIARANHAFVDTWTFAAKNQLTAITRTNTPIIDEQGQFLFSAYVGTVLPSYQGRVMVPVKNRNQKAIIKYAEISAEQSAPMPMTTTPHHFAMLMQTMINRPYGWGSMYFYNDCSAELKSLFTPFGIWLPRHSSAQVTAGKMVDMTSSAAPQRLSYLFENGQRFLTLVYIGGHVVMYVGKYPNPNSSEPTMAMTYQNIWGLAPKPSVRRAVIGQSVLFPMLLRYSEDSSLASLADKSFFQVSYLDQLPSMSIMRQQGIDMKDLMYPETLFTGAV